MNDIERYRRDRASVMSMLKFILIVAIVIAFCYAGKIVAVILVPFLIGFLLAKTSVILAKPFSKPFEKTPSKVRSGKKSASTKIALTIYVILIIFVILLIILTFIGLIYQANSILVSLGEATRSFKPSGLLDVQFLNRFSVENGGFLSSDMMESLKENIANMGQTVVKNIPQVVSAAFSKIWALVGNLPYAIFFVISIILSGFYFINDGPAVMKLFVKNTPNRKFRNRIFTLLNELSLLVFRVLGGYFVLFVITAIESFIVFWFAGLHEYAIVLSIITALIDFLPVLGVSATMIPMMIYQVAHGEYISSAVLVAGLILMTIIRRFVEPAVLGKSLKMHPLVTLIAMAAGVYIWGAAGFLLGPVLAIILIQAIKVFDLDKTAGKYLSNVLDRLMVDKDDKKKKGEDAKTSADGAYVTGDAEDEVEDILE
ncbi:MAG: AI-2E family transporter [Clostridiales bacterium]|nr:AI-2E family transporter [Clostridiales bacterium]